MEIAYVPKSKRESGAANSKFSLSKEYSTSEIDFGQFCFFSVFFFDPSVTISF